MTNDSWESLVPFAGLLGIAVEEADRSGVRATLAWREELCTTGGAMHGGAIMSLADTTGAILAFLNLPDADAGTTTISSATQFIRGLSRGTAQATARLLHAGRTTIVVETDVTDAGGKLVARVTQTQAVLTA